MPELPQELTLESAKNYIEGMISETPPLEFIEHCSSGIDQKGFDWRNYIEIKKLDSNITDEEFRAFKADMEVVLDKLSTLPEIQQSLENNRKLYSSNILGFVLLPSKIALSPNIEIDSEGKFLNPANIIYLNPLQLANYYKVNKEGKEARASIYPILGHEIFHAGDPQVKAAGEAAEQLLTAGEITIGNTRSKADMALVDRAYREVIAVTTENAAVLKLEKKISFLVGEVARSNYNDFTHLHILQDNFNFVNKLIPEVEMTLAPSATTANWGCGIKAPGR